MKYLILPFAAGLLIGCGSDDNNNSDSVALKNDLNGDGYADIIVGDPEINTQTGQVTILFGPDFSQSLSITGEAEYDQFATDLDASGDINGDGITDLVVSAMESDSDLNLNQDGGKAYVFYGRQGFDQQTQTNAERADVIITSTVVEGEILGGEITLGDLNHDGFDDVIVANGRSSSQVGKIYVFNGSATGIVNTEAIALTNQASYTISGTANKTGFAVTNWYTADEPGDLAIGDMNNDGIDDLVVGSPRLSIDQSSTEGYIHVFYGVDGDRQNITVDDADIEINGIHDTMTLRDSGSGITIADFNNDEVMDVGFGHPDSLGLDPNASSSYTGGYSIFFGPLSATQAGQDADVIITSMNGSEDLGSEAVAGDFNGDGIMDIAIGDEEGRYNPTQESDPLSDAGAVYIFFGPDLASGDITTADVTIDGVTQNETVGRALATGDINDDGLTDLIVGAEADTNADAGYVYVFHGRTVWPSALTTSDSDTDITDDVLESGFGKKLAE